MSASASSTMVELPSSSNDQPVSGGGKKGHCKGPSVKMSNVIYLGRIPHGFYEDQMKAYFSQFGSIANLRLSRNKKTGASKHYAFIEFKDPEVAEIVADTMNNYLMFASVLKCHVLPVSKVHPEMWKGANRRFTIPKKKKIPTDFITTPSSKQLEKRLSRFEKRSALKKRRLEALGLYFSPEPSS